MILQQLAEDAERIVGELPPPMYDRRPVRWVLELDEDGALTAVIRTSSGDPKRDRGAEQLVPFVTRTSGVRAILLVDTPAYTLGLAPDDRRAPEKHAAYLELLQNAAEVTGNAEVGAVLRFLQRRAEGGVEPEPLREVAGEMEKSDLITFRVAGRLPIRSPAIRAFWAQKCAGEGGAGAPESECLVCGERKPIEESLPVPIKRVPQGQSSGVAPVSVNADAFESYGLKRGRTCGVCRECGERFGKALNELLARDDSHLAVGPLVYVFWTQEGPGFSQLTLLSRPDPETVRDLLSSYRPGHFRSDVDETAFYATALSASGGRAVIRDWLHTTLGTAKANLARWFELLRQVDAYGAPGDPIGVFRLGAGLYRDANKEMVAQVPQVLVKAALHGNPLPAWMLAQAVSRCRAERAVTYPRAALIKAVLVCIEGKEETYMSALEPAEARPAYLCGRLLSVLEEIQRLAIPGINATLVDRFYGSACTAPASVFGNLLSDAQAHLSKLRRTRGPAYHALQTRLEEVLGPLKEFPKTLTLQEQALFSLGYYHQRAADRAAAREHKAAAEALAAGEAGTEEKSNE